MLASHSPARVQGQRASGAGLQLQVRCSPIGEGGLSDGAGGIPERETARLDRDWSRRAAPRRMQPASEQDRERPLAGEASLHHDLDLAELGRVADTDHRAHRENLLAYSRMIAATYCTCQRLFGGAYVGAIAGMQIEPRITAMKTMNIPSVRWTAFMKARTCSYPDECKRAEH